MIDIDISREGIEDEEPPSTSWIEKVVSETLKAANLDGHCEVSVLVTDDQKMSELNLAYRDKNKTTDVLSFAFEEGEGPHPPAGCPRVLGDIIISLPQLERQASENKVSFPRECAWALCHGSLHLLGYDHQNDEEEKTMRELEARVLEKLGAEVEGW